MPGFICTTCGTQYEPSDRAPASCAICQDERQYVGRNGQTWTTLAALRRNHLAAFHEHEPGLMGIGIAPSFAIGQRALLVRTGASNVLWDCVPFIDEAVVDIVRALGGITAIAISHPHFYASMVEWSLAFKAPILLHAADREWVKRQSPSIRYWEGETHEVASGLTLIRTGGHFEGSAVLHWAAGADGDGALLTGDSVQVMPDKSVSFMRSYPNLIPLDAASVQRIDDVLRPWPFRPIYGGWFDRAIATDGKAVLSRSISRYVAAVTTPPGR